MLGGGGGGAAGGLVPCTGNTMLANPLAMFIEGSTPVAIEFTTLPAVSPMIRDTRSAVSGSENMFTNSGSNVVDTADPIAAAPVAAKIASRFPPAMATLAAFAAAEPAARATRCAMSGPKRSINPESTNLATS